MKLDRMSKHLFLDNRHVELGTSWQFDPALEIKRAPHVDGKGMIYGDIHGPCARVKRVMHQPTRHGDFPLIGPDKPWEGTLTYFGGHYLNREPDTGRLRMYYQAWTLELAPEIAVQSNPSNPTAAVPGVNTIEHGKLCMAVSEDGLKWEKPELGEIEWEGSKENNIVLDERICGTIWGGVMYDEIETDPRRKWKAMTFGSPGDWHGVCIYFSPDGIHWTPWKNNPVLTARIDAGDSYVLFGYDKRINKYVAYIRPQDWYRHYPDTPYHRVTSPSWPFGASLQNHPYRTMGRSVSDDFVHWSVPEEIIAPDLDDEFGTQFYGMTVGTYEDYYIGNLWIYNLGSHDDRITMQLAVSQDGIKWQRVGNRKPFIDVGDEGPFHSQMILATTSPYLVMGDEIWIYYAAFNCTHYGTRFPEREAGIGLCKLRLDGWVGLASEGEEGYFLSRPFDLEGEPIELEINADASKGYVKVAVVGEDHQLVPGYSQHDCVALAEDRIHHTVRWKQNENLQGAGDRRVYFMFRLKDAEIFSYSLNAIDGSQMGSLT